jgi:type I restriction enzyme S subunit
MDRLLQVGDVVVNFTGVGTLGRVIQLRDSPKEPTTVDSHVTIVRPIHGKFYPDFFGFMLRSIEDQIQGAGEGCGGQTELARSTLANKFLVKYPESKSEQRRIVRILDQVFAAIAKAEANTENNLQNVHALLEGFLESLFTKGKVSWPIKKLKDVAEVQSGGTPSISRADFWSGDLPWYSSGELNGLFTANPEM